MCALSVGTYTDVTSPDMPLTRFKGEAMLRVRAIPGASRDEIIGLHEDEQGEIFLKLKVRAKPDKGGANKAIIQLLSKELGVPKSDISLHAGDTNRATKFLLSMEPEQVAERLRRLLG